MKKLNPEQIKKDLGSAKKVTYTPAGAKGLDKLKLAVCRGLRKTMAGVAEMFDNDDTIALSVMGAGVLGLGALSKGVSGHGLPNVIEIPSIVAASAVGVKLVSNVAEKGLRNLEAAILKRIRKNEANPLITAKVMEQAHAR